jgi:hypothetical protein
MITDINLPIFNPQDIQQQYESHSEKRDTHLVNLANIVIRSGDKIEENIISQTGTLEPCLEFYAKQLNMFWCGKTATPNKICEIGFNAGHSAMILLLGREKTPLNFTIFDIGHHIYTLPCMNYIASEYSNVQFEYIQGDSTVYIPKWLETNQFHIGQYDLVHVDGGRGEVCVMSDMKYADLLTHVNGIIIVNETNQKLINATVELYLATGRYVELNVLKLNTNTQISEHRIIKKLRDL